jgi:aldehyde dehydrogenase (NAD+)
LAKIAVEVGIPAGVVNVVTGGRETGEALVDHKLVRKVSFIGSVGAGRTIAARAGSRLVPATLELGGKSPNIVFDDADLDHAEAGVLAGIFAAAGQSCVAGSRAYIHYKIYDEFVNRLVSRANKIVLGDPLAPGTQMGPVATRAQLEKDISIVERATAAGSEILCGGAKVCLEEFPGGFFFPPTILHKVKPDNPVMRNEVFGPVLAVTSFADVAEVCGYANSSEFGLAAGVWTRDIKRAHLTAREIEAGTIWINTYRSMAFNSPFGGYKSSGIGRVNGLEGIKPYLQTKSVWCELGDEILDPFVLKA